MPKNERPRSMAADIKCVIREGTKRWTKTVKEADIAFMFRDFDSTRSTRRVELNAMTSPQFITFIERKLRQHGIQKVVPGTDDLADAYRLFARSHAAEKIVRRELKKMNGGAAVEVPQDIETRVRQHLARNPADRWDGAVRLIATAKHRREQVTPPARNRSP
jgi:hypothetical protein